MAFEIAAKGAFREGMSKCGPKLLEPVMEVDVITPEESMGDVIGDLPASCCRGSRTSDAPCFPYREETVSSTATSADSA